MSDPLPSAPARADTGPGLNRVWRTSLLYLIGNVAGRAIGFLAIPFYSRFLTPAEYGLIELIDLSTTAVAIGFGLQSIGPAMTRLHHDQHDTDGERSVISTSVIATALFSGIVAATAVLASAPLSRAVFGSAEHAPLLQAAFAAMFLGNLAEVVLVYERIRERARLFLAYAMVTLAATLALNILFIGVLHAGVWGFVLSKLVVTSGGVVWLLARLVREVGWRWRPALLPGLVRFGAPLILSSLAYFAIHSSDRFFLSAAVGLADLGRYALAYRFAFLLSILVGDSFKSSWDVAYLRHTTEAGWQRRIAVMGTYLTFALYLTALAIALAGPELLRVMVPPSYFPPRFLLPLLLLAYVLREIGDFFQSLLLINRRTVLFSQVALFGAVLNLGLNLLLIPAHGLFGAAAATLLTWTAHVALCWAIAWREHRVPLRLGPFAGMSGLAVAIFAGAEATRTEAWLPQLGLDAAWGLLFVGLCAALVFSAAERAEARRALLAATAPLLAAGRGVFR